MYINIFLFINVCECTCVGVKKKKKKKHTSTHFLKLLSPHPPAPLLPDIFTHMAWLVVRAERWDKETDNA